MKTFVLAAAGLVVAASAAQAADLIVAPATDYSTGAVSVYDASPWTGFYAGGSLGIVTSDDFDEDYSAGTIGLQGGYLQQFGVFVLGAEVEAMYLDELTYELDAVGGLTQDWSAALKARGGIALDHTLLYGTLGYGWTSFESYGDASVDEDAVGGLVWGLGVEQSFGNGVSARVEYLQANYDDVESVVGGLSRSDDLTTHAVKAGVNFRF